MFGRVSATLGGRASARHARAFFYSYHRMNTHQRRNFTLMLADHHSRVTWSDAIIFAVLAFGGMISLCATMLVNIAMHSTPADVDETFYQLWKTLRDPSKRFEFERAHRAELAYPELKDKIGEIDHHPEGSTAYLLPELSIPDDITELRSRRSKEALREAQQNLKSVNEKKILSAAGIDRNLLDKALSNPTQLTSSQVERLKKGLTAVQVARKLAGDNHHLYRDASFSSFRTQAHSVKEALSEDSVQGLGVLARTFGVRVKDADKALADLTRQDKELAAAVEEVVPALKAKFDLIAPGKEEFAAYRAFWQDYLNKTQRGVLTVTKKDGKSIPTILEGTALTGYLSDYAARTFAPQAQDPFYAVGLSVFNRGTDAQLATDLANADELYSQLAAKILGSGYDTRARASSPLA